MLELQRFLIKEQVAFLRAAGGFDIYDPETKEHVGLAREFAGPAVRIFRWFLRKSWLPWRLEVLESEDESLLCTIRRPIAFGRHAFYVYDADEYLVGSFIGKMFSWGPGFWVYDRDGEPFAEVKGDLPGWNFAFVSEDGDELGRVTKKWAGLGRELFTSADSYLVSVNDELSDQPLAKMLLLCAALAIDVVYRES